MKTLAVLWKAHRYFSELATDETRKGYHATFNGGYKEPKEHEAFHHGMDTVFNGNQRTAKDFLEEIDDAITTEIEKGTTE